MDDADFDDITQAKIQKIKNLIEELPPEASSHFLYSIFAGYARLLDQKHALVSKIVNVMEREGAILLLFKGDEYQVEASLAADAPDVLGEVLDILKQEIHNTLRPKRKLY